MRDFKNCQHCGRRIYSLRRVRFCSPLCLVENKYDSYANPQRIGSFQALADAGSWLALDNITLYALADPSRKVKLLEECKLGNLICYRLTPAGHKLLERWKSQLAISV